MRRLLVIVLLFLLPFQVLAASLGGTAVPAFSGMATPCAPDAAGLAGLAGDDTHAGPVQAAGLADQLDEEGDEASANADLGDALMAMSAMVLPCDGLASKPDLHLHAPASLLPSVPKPPPEA
ncbi:MAG: hypothetical protein ACRYGK_05010 [Janthinobacterium lividum]